VVAAEMALRRNLVNGKCVWNAKKGWQKKDCQNRTWLPTKYDDVGELFYYRMKQLKSSVGTKIKDYTAFSRAIDGAGNVEKQFTKKRNMNTFEAEGQDPEGVDLARGEDVRGTRRYVGVLLAGALVLGSFGVATAATSKVRAKGEKWRPVHTYIGRRDSVQWSNPPRRCTT
jgi:hypothetical protein